VHNTRYISGTQIAVSEIRFGRGSDFGFKNASHFFDLPAIHSESPIIMFGIGSVSVCIEKDKKKTLSNLELRDA